MNNMRRSGSSSKSATDAALWPVDPADDHTPVASPARGLQQALEATYAPVGRDRRWLSIAMLILTLICVYAVAALALGGSLGA
jgi:hypothetical protein